MKPKIKSPFIIKVTAVLILLSFVYSSCKKDHAEENAQGTKLYTLTYHVNGFTQSDTVFNSSKQTTNSIKVQEVPVSPALIDLLLCKVYDVNGKVVKTITQKSTESGFGTLSIKLSPGNYTFVFAGGKKGLYIGRSYFSEESSLDDDIIGYNNIGEETPLFEHIIGDTFYKKLNVTVGDNSVNSITLNRIVAQLEITIQDKLPSNVKYITTLVDGINAVPVNGDAPIVNGEFPWVGLTTEIPSAKIGTSNYTVKLLVFNTAAPFKLTLLAHSGKDAIDFNEYVKINWRAVIAGKEIPNVTAAANKTTIVKGNLFGGNGTTNTGGFSVSINSNWDTNVVTVPF